MESLPSILFKVGKGRKLSDIEFLAIKEFDGKLKKNEGVKTTTGDLATLTATSGKDMYIARAKITVYNDGGGTGASQNVVVLKINGIIIETSGTRVNLTSESYEFKNMGHKVAATQIIKLEVITINAAISIEGFIECFEETTGETPQIPST